MIQSLMKMPMPADLKQLRSLLGGLPYYRKLLRDIAKRIRPITSLLKQGVKFVFAPAIETIVRELLAEFSTPPVLVYPNWDAVSDNPRPFLYWMPVWTVLVPPSTKSKMTTPFAPLCSSAALPPSRNVTGPRSIWKREASSRASSAFAVTCGVPVSDFFQTTRRSKARQDRRTQPASTAVDRIPYGVQLHPRISQRQCQRERRFSLPPAFACDGARPRWPRQSYSVRRRTRLPHPLARPTSWRTLRRACRLGWAGALRPQLWLGWAHALPSRFSRFSQTRAPNEG